MYLTLMKASGAPVPFSSASYPGLHPRGGRGRHRRVDS